MWKQRRNEVLVLPKTNQKIEKFINYIMEDWKKNLARKIFYKALDEIKKNWHFDPYVVWETAIENASPQIMVRSKRIWGAVYQVPLEVGPKKRFFYSSKWILEAVRAKKGQPIHKALAEELMAAYSDQWSAMKKKENVHKMAEANKAYAYMAKYVK